MTERPKRIPGFASWNARRLFGVRVFFGAASNAASDAVESVHETVDTLRPAKRLRRSSFIDRYSDGGVARYRQLTEHTEQSEIQVALAAWDRDRIIYLVCGTAALIGFPALLLLGQRSPYLLIGMATLAFLYFALALKADFRGWQIRQGRVGSVFDYLNHRLPPNMHILSRED